MLNSLKLKLCIFLLNLFCIDYSKSFQCLDEEGEPVYWFVAYKLPRVSHSKNELIKHGLAYAFMTSKDYTSWNFSKNSINDTKSLIGKTLEPLFQQNLNDNFYILYNDQPPYGEPKDDKGHNKGVILAEEHEGFWLVHSVPHFPNPGVAYSFPHSGATYGQSFLCISLDVGHLDIAGDLLLYNEPQVYSQNVPTPFKPLLPNLVNIVYNMTINNPPWFKTTTINLQNRDWLLAFAKSKHFGKDLYADLVAPALKMDLFTETWLNGEGRLPSDCTKPYKVNNVESISMAFANFSFSSSRDHSKWAISQNITELKSSWICIGDINRMAHQEKRGGGTLCICNQKLARNYMKLISKTESCSNER